MLSYLFDFQKSMERFKGNFILSMWSKKKRKKTESEGRMHRRLKNGFKPNSKVSQHSLIKDTWSHRWPLLSHKNMVWNLTSVIICLPDFLFDLKFGLFWLCLNTWSHRWILISSLIIYLFIFNQVSFDQHWGGIWDIWYVLMCLFLKKRPSFGIIGTVNHLLACDYANVPSPCIWVNLPLNLLTRWKLNILSNCDPWELRCVCNFKKFLWQGIYNFPIASIYN